MDFREPAKTFQDLIVWQRAHAFVLDVYSQTKSFPREETYGLTGQLRRAAVSIPANIAEGFRRKGRPDKVRLLNIAQSSLEESRYYLILTKELGYTNSSKTMDTLEEVSRLLDAYMKSIVNSMG